MKISVYNLLMNEYAKLRHKAESAAEDKKNAIYAGLPDLAEIDDRIRLEGIEYTVRMVNADERAAESLEKVRRLKERKSEILKLAGLKPDVFDIVYRNETMLLPEAADA
jgi:hypothetical protein